MVDDVYIGQLCDFLKEQLKNNEGNASRAVRVLSEFVMQFPDRERIIAEMKQRTKDKSFTPTFLQSYLDCPERHLDMYGRGNRTARHPWDDAGTSGIRVHLSAANTLLTWFGLTDKELSIDITPIEMEVWQKWLNKWSNMIPSMAISDPKVEHMLKAELLGYKVYAILDFMFKKKEHHMVYIDWKTGMNAHFHESDIDRDIQLLLIAWLIFELHPEVEYATVGQELVRYDKWVHKTYSRAMHFELLENTIKTVIQSFIDDHTFQPTICKRCSTCSMFWKCPIMASQKWQEPRAPENEKDAAKLALTIQSQLAIYGKNKKMLEDYVKEIGPVKAGELTYDMRPQAKGHEISEEKMEQFIGDNPDAELDLAKYYKLDITAMKRSKGGRAMLAELKDRGIVKDKFQRKFGGKKEE